MSEALDETGLDPGAGEPAAEPADAVADPAATDGEPAATEGGAAAEPAAPAWPDEEWTAPSREEWEAQQALTQLLVGAIDEPEGGASAEPGEQGRVPLDPLADDYEAQLDAREAQRDQRLRAEIRADIQQMLNPVLASHEQQEAAEGEARVKDALADYEARNGEFASGEDARGVVRELAEIFFPEAQARYRNGYKAAEASLDYASQLVRAIEQKAGEAAVTKYKNEISTLSGARSEPGTGSVGVTTVPQRGDELDLAARWAS